MDTNSAVLGFTIVILFFGFIGIFYKKFMRGMGDEQSLQHQSKHADTADSSDEDTVL